MLNNQLFKFIIVGGLSTVLNYTIFASLYFFNVYYILASVIGYFSGLILGYLLNRSWSFSSVTDNKKIEFIFYSFVYLFSLALSVAALRLAVDNFGVDPLLGNFLAIAVSTIINFIGLKFLIFNKRIIDWFKKNSNYFDGFFWCVLSIKVLSSFFFASKFVTEGFLPFIDYFVTDFHNPYNYFFNLGQNIFPYPGGMLFITSFPFILFKSFLPFQIFLFHLPILFFDVLLYVVLCHLLPFKQKKVFWLYFASPILFYINYFHGQLDVIPTALLFLSIVFLFNGLGTFSFIFFGLGIATKTHLLLALPFYVVYLIRHNTSVRKIFSLTAVSIIIFFIFNPYFFSSGFINLVFNNPEQQRLFNLFIPFGFNNLQFFLAPAAIVFLFYKFTSYQRLNKDSLLLVLGLVYAVLVALVPPMQGWFYWSLPFLIFFFIKFKNSPTGGPPWLSFWVINISYLLYFLIPPFNLISQNIIFTILEASLIVSVWWLYKVGISSNRLYQLIEKPLFVGIAGDSGVGKSTLANSFEKIVGSINFLRVDGDDVHRWERGHENWKIFTHLNPKSNNIHLDLQQSSHLLNGEIIERKSYDHATGKFTTPLLREAKRFIVFQGLMPFILENMRNLFHFKIFLETEESLRVDWKLKRDQNERNYSKSEIEKEIERRRPDAERFIHPQKDFADIIIRYNYSSIEYKIKNSIFMDNFISHLSSIPSLKVEHDYLDLNFQTVNCSGVISKKEVEQIAFSLAPNLTDLIENNPQFEENYNGINQLFIINLLKSFYERIS